MYMCLQQNTAQLQASLHTVLNVNSCCFAFIWYAWGVYVITDMGGLENYKLTVWCLHPEMLARPFLMSSSNEAAAADALTDLLRVCLGKKQSHLQRLLANIIGIVATGTASATATAENTAAGAVSEAASGAAAEAPGTTAAEAPHVAASEAVVSMLDAVADRLLPHLDGNLHQTGRKQQQNKAVSKITKMDLVQQQESAAQMMLAYASRGGEEQQMVLQLYFSRVSSMHQSCCKTGEAVAAL